MRSPASPFTSRTRCRTLLRLTCAIAIATSSMACAGTDRPREPDLPEQPDRWVETVALDADSRLKFVGRTRDYLITEVSEVKAINRAEPSISVGDEIRGLRIGAIKCSFHWRDASYGGDQYMWRGRWACQAGRNRQEVEQAVTEDGGKRYDYLHVAPVRLP